MNARTLEKETRPILRRGVYLRCISGGKWFLFPQFKSVLLPRAMFNNSSPYTAKTTAGGGGGGVGDASFPPQSPFASGGGQHQQGQHHQFGSTGGNPFENQRARTTPTTTPFGNETSRNNEAPTTFGGRGVGGGSSSLFTSSPAPNANTSTFVGNKDDVSPPQTGSVGRRFPLVVVTHHLCFQQKY